MRKEQTQINSVDYNYNQVSLLTFTYIFAHSSILALFVTMKIMEMVYYNCFSILFFVLLTILAKKERYLLKQ